ncbi:hypothetical protein BJ875DRAFT_468148 [Amylocarpus encephaloides]|uniref:C2 domain-containing protein n=1 Tax=Amylocarpus encephaloides TaxID=45428 RepID=A0A9P7YEX6_9HELO|nr:hypothetical protein BJ875DRAFT_468148 [Amylocarpus encephaloides]
MPPKAARPAPNASASNSSRGDRTIRLLHDLTSRAWSNYTTFSKASPELKSTCDQILSIIGSLHTIEDYREKGEISTENKRPLQDIVIWLNGLFSDLEAELADLKEGHSPEGFAPIAVKQLDPNNQLHAFNELVRRDRQYKLWNALEEIHGNDSPESFTSVASNWTFLELQMHGFSKDVLQEEFFFVNDWFKGRKDDVQEDQPSVIATEEDDGPPDYTPGKRKDPMTEKIRDIDEATNAIALDGSTDDPTMLPKADPPPYTFEGDEDQIVDDAEFSHYIHTAVVMEHNLRSIQKDQQPELITQPTAWLPATEQELHKGSKEVVPMMEKDSFTVMAYESAPRCTEAIDRLTRLFKVTFESTLAEPVWGVVHEGLQSLIVMTSALMKFTRLENQLSNSGKVSDLDILQFEYTTAVAMDPGIQFPHREFDIAQKSYYRLLTYVMGFLEAMHVVFPGRTYVTRTKEDLELSWKNNLMPSRVAWVEKQLAGWGDVDVALSFCRDWHRLRPRLRQQAFDVLKQWEKSESILSGADGNDPIEITVIAAAALSRSSFRVPTPFAKVIYYGPNRFGGAMRVSEQKTEISGKTTNPVWNKRFQLQIIPMSKFIDIEIGDRLAGMDKQLATARLAFSYTPGVEASFLDKSLVYGYDEEIEVPLKEFEGKGKERDPPIVRLRLKWPGRIARVEELGLPSKPPGKMFRPGIVGIPYTPEEKHNVKMGGPPRRGSTARGSVS